MLLMLWLKEINSLFFGETYDHEKTKVTLEIISVLPDFMTFDDGKLTIGPLLKEQIGTFEI